MSVYEEALRSAWVEIDRTALRKNLRNIRACTNRQAIVVAVVKADAYGHGSVECAKVFREEGVRHFAVATIQEAIELREAGIEDPIVVLGLIPDALAHEIAQYDLAPVIASVSDAACLAEAAAKAGKRIDCLVAVDSGMGRIGYRVNTPEHIEMAEEEIRQIDEFPEIRIVGIISHFAASDEAPREYTRMQIHRFNDFFERLAEDGVSLPWKTIANSAAVMEYPSAHFDAVRPGIILYGCYPSDEVHPEKLELYPAMSVKACIVYLKTVPPGTSVSYGRKFTTERESRIATIGIGYADGYSRVLTGKAEVLVHGRRAPVIGSICMDQCMVDVTDIPDVSVGDEVVVMGADGDDRITAEELAVRMGTINYEILCSFGMRLHKVYVD